MNDSREQSPLLTAEEQAALAEIPALDPEALLKPVERTRLGRLVAFSVLAHVLVLGLTSFGLYRDWAHHGLKLPATIRLEKKQARIDAEKAARDAEMKAREAERAARAEAEAAAAATNKTAAGETPPPVIPEGIDPEDPIKSFELNEDILNL